MFNGRREKMTMILVILIVLLMFLLAAVAQGRQRRDGSGCYECQRVIASLYMGGEYMGTLQGYGELSPHLPVTVAASGNHPETSEPVNMA